MNHSNRTWKREFQKNSKKIKKRHMDSFQAKTGRDRLRMREKKIFLFRSIPTRPGMGNSKKIAKKFKKLKNIVMASFQAKMGRDRLRMREKKIFSFWSIPTRHGIGNSKNIAKKCQKLKKTLLWLNFDTERDGTGWDWEKKKIYRSDPFIPDL